MASPRIIDSKYLVAKVFKETLSGVAFTDALAEANQELTDDGVTWQLAAPEDVRIAAKLFYPERRDTTPAIAIRTTGLNTEARAATQEGFQFHRVQVIYTTAHHPASEEDQVQYHNAYGAAISATLVRSGLSCKIVDVVQESWDDLIYTHRDKRAFAMAGVLTFLVQTFGRA